MATLCWHGPAMTATTSSAPTAEHWEFVQNLLHDLQADDDREQIASHFGQWLLSIKAFRRVESSRMTSTTPTDMDRLFHRACVTDLISLGTMIEISALDHEENRLALHGVRMDVIRAMLADLQNTLDEWHAQVPPERIADLQEKIFHAAPELNFANP